MNHEEINQTLLGCRGLGVLRGVLESPGAQDLLKLLETLGQERPDPMLLSGTFGRLWSELAREPDPLLPDAWQSHLVGRILDDENPFSLGAERGEASPMVVEQARRDLRVLRSLFDLDSETLISAVEHAAPELTGLWTPWTVTDFATGDSQRHTVANKLSQASDWSKVIGLLEDHYARHGAGLFGSHRAFRWSRGALAPVERPDPISLKDLIGYERDREPLRLNTRRLLAGLPAHHALLYGLPGTGKSSTVKALLNEYADEGLKLVEMAKEDLGELPRLLEVLRGRGPRFILFVDDLSFEEHEVEYKSLKALLEGSVEEPPENVRVYATSNRRNLIREAFSDREEDGSDDVHARDTMQEKLSLSARFGLRLTFPTPNQKRYLEIVRGLAKRRDLELPGEDLEERALLWDRWHAGRSGRTARQFVDELEAELNERR